jgi:predicted enzyme related to lactoylglutathione lyase
MMPTMTTDRIEYAHGALCWVDLNSHDMNAAAAWYGELLGWRFDLGRAAGGPPYGIFSLREKPVAGLGEMSAEMRAQGVPPVWNTYVDVEDAGVIERRVVELGGEVVFPSTKLGEVGTLAFFRDPSGASFAIWQRGTHGGAQLVGNGTWCWSELMSRDVAASKHFYGELFGWRFKSDGEYTEIFVGERAIGGMLGIDPAWGPVPPSWGVYFEVADVGASTAAAARTGGRVLMGPKTIEHVGRFAMLADPQGGCFSLIQMHQHHGT